jgi:hypothetical protein
MFLMSGKFHCVLLPLFLLAMSTANGQLSSNVTVFASGLNNPRGLKFGPDSALYVAEGGLGGSSGTVGICDQVPPPIGPYTGGYTARISRIDSAGNRHTVVDGLPSTQTAPPLGFISGVADIAFIHDRLFALISGAGCSHGLFNTNNKIIEVDSRHQTWRPLADLSDFLKSHPAAHPNRDDFEPDGTWWNLIAVNDRLYTTEPNHGEIDVVNLDGTVHRVVDISETHGHIVPTALAFHDGLYFGNLHLFPINIEAANIFKITRDNRIRVAVPLLATVLGIAFDCKNRLYILETSAQNGNPTPGQGMILRADGDDRTTVVASGLTFPTGMAFGKDGKLYVSNFGFGFPEGSGQIIRVTVPE